MTETGSGPGLADRLLEGPRGRRLLLNFALTSERLHDPEYRDGAFSAGVFLASYHLDPGKGTSVVLFGHGDEEAAVADVGAEEVAQRLVSVPLAEVTTTLLRDCLVVSVDTARYWQEPDGHDVLAATRPMRAALSRVAQHIAASPLTDWWGPPVAEQSQWAVNWKGARSPRRKVDPAAVLRTARDREIDGEVVARRQRSVDPTANWSGDWWSRPPWQLLSSGGTLADGSPVKLWLVEDSLGWERAQVQRLGVPSGLRVYEIDSTDAWARLCARFPLEVTAQKRHDWYRTTGRTGTWVIPDWVKVAEHYAAVHLQVQAYLAAAGTAIPVDEHSGSVIAGWDPDQTYWFAPNVRYLDEPVTWMRKLTNDQPSWLNADESAE